MGPVLHGIKKGGSSVNRISVLSYLDETYLKYPDKTAFFSEAGNMTFLHLYQYSRSAGSYLADSGYYRKPIVVFMRKSSEMIAAFLGVVRGGAIMYRSMRKCRSTASL